MSSSMYGTTDGYRSGSPRERAISSALSLAIIILVILIAVWQIGVIPKQFGMGKGLTTFDIASSDKTKSAAPTASRQTAAKARSRVVAKTATPQRPRIVISQSKAVQQQQELAIPGFIHMSRDDLAAGDIGKLHGSSTAQGGGNGGGKSAYGPGEGPGGMHLFAVEWYREPTDAELSTYMPKVNPGSGWGEVACDTIAHYHVENCQILGESPRGSGYGRAVLNAAWQFLVRPPRVNGEMKIGAPVRIRITYSERGARSD